MTLAEAGVYSFAGILTVFFALVLLMFVIKILTKLTDTAVPQTKTDEPTVKAADANIERPLAPGSAGDIKLYDTDLRDAAMIMAIVADEMKKPINELRFISIKEVKK